MKLAVFGAGRMAEIRIEDLVTDRRVTGITVVNRNLDRALDLATRFGIEVVATDKFRAEDFESYLVTTATAHHADALEGVIGPDRRILCEKPIALELRETDEILRKVVAVGAELQIGFQRRFDPPIAEAKRRIDAGTVGMLYHLRFASHDHQPSSWEFLAGSGGIFRDLHVHDFDLVEWLCDSLISEVYATRRVRAHEQYAEFDDGDVALVHAVTESGVQVSISGTRHDPRGHDVRFEVFGSKDSLSAGLSPRTPLDVLDDDFEVGADPYRGFVERFREAFRAETKAYVDWVHGDVANPCPPASARSSTCVAIACERSVREGRVVKVADVRGST